jgi:PAS domain S-box
MSLFPPSVSGSFRSWCCRLCFLTGLLGLVAPTLHGQPNAPAASESEPVITEIHDFWNVVGDAHKKPHRVRLVLEIDHYDPDWNIAWAHADGKGYYVGTGPKRWPLRPGHRILAEGWMTPAEGLSLAQCEVTILGTHPRPEPMETAGIVADAGRFQNQVVHIEGYVQRQMSNDAQHHTLELISEGILVSARLYIPGRESIPNFLDTRVRATGIYAGRTNGVGELIQIELWMTGSDNIKILSRNSDDPRFTLPTTEIERLPFLPEDAPVKVSGTVQSSERGQSVSLRDSTGQVKLLTKQTLPIRIGEAIEAVGTPFVRGNEWILRDGLFRTRAGAISQQADTSERSVLRLTEQVLDLRPEEAAHGTPVKLTGVVTWSRNTTRYIYLQDTTGGLRVEIPSGDIPTSDLLFNLVEITGVTTAGTFAPEVVADNIQRLGQTSVPVARPISLEQAMTGTDAGQWVEMRGYLRDVVHKGPWTRLTLTGTSGEFIVQLPHSSELDALVGSNVRTSGVCVVDANERRELTRVWLLSPGNDAVQVEEPAAADPFAVPLRTIANLRQFSPLQSFNRRVRIKGQVVHQVPGRYIQIQDGVSGLLALTRGTTPVTPGDLVELSGLPGREGQRLILRETVYRRIGGGLSPEPTPLTSFDEINDELDGRLVHVSGHLLESSHRNDDTRLLIQTATGSFEARLAERDFTRPSIGAEVRLTGIYQIEHDEYRQPRGFHLRLRSENDIEVLSAPSWWTTARALYAAAILLACVLLVVVWLTILRRRVKQQTEQIRQQLEKEAVLEARHRNIIENASDFIFTLDDKGHITSFNPAGKRITGLSRDEAIGRHFNDLLAPQDRFPPLPIFTLKSDSEIAITCQTRFQSPDKRITWVEISARTLVQPGRPHSVLAVARDISERKQIEEELRRARDAAEAATRAKSAFLANMSHEIRTPMNGVIGMSNLLLETRLSDEQRDFTETIRNSAESLLTVLNDILDFSKIEAGKLQFETIDFDLHETVESTLELLAARASDKGLELASYLPAGLPRWVRGDPGRLRQVLVNLIGNAIKFTEKGEVVVAVALERETDRDVRLHFDITDTGPGLDLDAQSRLFQPFSQADSSTTRKFGGTGLGLAISRQIVELMDGDIGVRSTPGRGSTFWFTVRLDKQPHGVARDEPARITALNGLRALIVDDNATNRKILLHYCASWGLRGEPVTNGPAALAALREAAAANDPYRLVLTDYQMPEMDGLMLAREIQTDATISSARIVLLTSWDRRVTREELSSSGVVRMLVKPIRQQDLLGALLRCVRIGFNSGTGTSGSNPSRSSPPDEDPAPRTSPTTRPLRILIAEDNIVNQRVAALQLRNLGHVVEIAANGLEVLKALETATYDVIFMDGQMPELDGYETTRRIRQNPATSGIYIIAMTANAMQGDRERCLEAGMDDYISKPTRPDDLHAALARCPHGDPDRARNSSAS